MKKFLKDLFEIEEESGAVWTGVVFGILMILVTLYILLSAMLGVIGGLIALILIVGIYVGGAYYQSKKSNEENSDSISASNKPWCVSKQSILSGMYMQLKQIQRYSLPISIVITFVFFLIYKRFNDLTDLSRLNFFIIIEFIVLLIGFVYFVSASIRIKKFDKIELVFYKRPVIKKGSSIGFDGEQDKYQFEFEGFSFCYEMVQGVNFSDEINIGDECVLVCYKGSKTIIDMYCMKIWDISEDILMELK